MSKRPGFALAVFILSIAVGAAASAQSGFSREILQRADLSAPGREAVTAVAVFEPGGTAARHTHPGEEIGYVLEGELVVDQDGKAPTTFHTGQAFIIPAGTIHGAHNATGRVARIVATYVVEKGKPLATPAP